MNKMIYLIAFVFFTITFGFGQVTTNSHRFFIGYFVSPDLSSRLDGGYTITSQAIHTNGTASINPKLSYTFGVDALYQFNTHFSISLGCQYSIKGENIKNNILTFIPNNVEPYKENYSIYTSYIDLPLRVDYYLNKHKVAPFVSAGISTNLFLNERIRRTQIFMDGHEKYYDIKGSNEYAFVNAQYQIGIGLDIAFESSRLRLYPIYRLSITPVNLKGANISGRFYSFGLGINYLFEL